MYWFTGILGLVLTVAPFVFGYSTNTAALWTSIVIGIATFSISWIEGAEGDREQWEYWTSAVLGLVAIAAPFVLGFAGHPSAMWTSVITGGLLAVFSGSKLLVGNWGKI